MKLFIIMFSSFAAGAIAGSFLYFTEFKPQFVTETDPLRLGDDSVVLTAVDGAEYVITARTFGGCTRTGACRSFRVVSDGTFVYKGKVDAEGVLEDRALEKINNVLTERTLQEMSTEVVQDNCSSFVDGIDVSYDIEFQDEVYALSTCGTAFEEKSDLGQVLEFLWNEVQK